jgi:very-short-patch-repair endonuclease
MAKFAGAGSANGIIYGQPQFFSPVHTPINWQIPSNRLEQYQWARFFYENEPKIAAAIDFYSYFPMNDWEHECTDSSVRNHFNKLKKRLELPKWTRLISHEIHKLGDCFPFIEIFCPVCGGGGRIGDEICEHEGGTISRIVILNPDYVDVHGSPLDADPVIAMRADEELMNMVSNSAPGHERLSMEMKQLIMSGRPIRLDNRNVSHLMYGESGYNPYGVGMIRRLFPTLSYKTKLMVAQWIVAERLIVPIKVVKVGSDERPAGPADIAAVQNQLAQTANDPNLTIVTHHAFELDWIGASGRVLTLSNEFEFINQEILDGMMINNALLNGEGPSFSNAEVGINAMIDRLQTFRREIANWIEEKIYRPEAIRQGFIDIDEETGEEEPIYPKIKWNSMNLRDKQQDKQFALSLYEKGLISAQTVLEEFGYDADVEIERKRYDSALMLTGSEDGGMGGGMDMGGGFGGPPMGGGMDMGGEGGMDMGGMPPDMGGGDMGGPPVAPGGDMGGGAPMSSSRRALSAADPRDYGGKVLKEKSRQKIDQARTKIYTSQQGQGSDTQPGQDRDGKGRIIFTKPERIIMEKLVQNQKNGIIKYNIVPQLEVNATGRPYSLDFGIPTLKIGIEADGETFHSSPKQISRDKERDQNLAQLGWTIIRFTDTEIEKRPEKVMQAVVQTIMQKEMEVKAAQEKGKS